MKCDVCLTNIPAGSKACPNCGFKIKTKTTVKSSTYDFDHIEASKPFPTFDYIHPPKVKNTSNIKDTIQSFIYTAIIIICIILYIILF